MQSKRMDQQEEQESKYDYEPRKADGTHRAQCIKLLQVRCAAPASVSPPQSFRLPDELLAHLPGTDGHLRACTRHAGAHAAVGLVELGFRRVAGLARFRVFLVQAFQRPASAPPGFVRDKPAPVRYSDCVNLKTQGISYDGDRASR